MPGSTTRLPLSIDILGIVIQSEQSVFLMSRVYCNLTDISASKHDYTVISSPHRILLIIFLIGWQHT